MFLRLALLVENLSVSKIAAMKKFTQGNAMGCNVATRRHVTLVEDRSSGIQSYRLLGPSGAEIKSFSSFARSLLKVPLNTRKQYCLSIASFFDFYFESAIHLTVKHDTETLTTQQLCLIVDSWREYLIDGESARSDLASKVSKTLASPMVSRHTASNKHAALTKFLRLSELHRRQTVELARVGFSEVVPDYEALLAELDHIRPVSLNERSEMIRSNMLSSIAGNRTHSRESALFKSEIAPEFDVSKAFPVDRIEEFLSELRSYRDKAFYCLLAASGCRTHEGLQLLWEDIDILQGEVRLISPYKRWGHSSYSGLTKLEREVLAWKGRATSETFLIEPFASMFFENLGKYHAEEYFPHGRHQFVFQVLRRPDVGRPYFLTDPSTRQDVFTRVAKKLGLPKQVDGPHTLRHAYGTYLVNYLPLREREYGLPIGLVRVAMGHASVKSTEKYAVLDKDLIRARVQFANLQVFHQGVTQSQLQFKIFALNAQIENLKKLELELCHDKQNS